MMKKIKFICLLTAGLLNLISSQVEAKSLVSEKITDKEKYINVTSYPDYFPFAEVIGVKNYPKLVTSFTQAMDQIASKSNWKLKYIPEKNLDQAINDTRRGEIKIFLGMYHDTKDFTGLEYIFPAVLNNPVHVITLPENRHKISKADDLKTLKGVYIQKEHFSDYVLNNFKNYNIQPANSLMEAYEKLFTGQIDYIAGSYYYNYVEACKIGLKDYVAFSKGALWNMPMFIGTSKAARDSKEISAVLKKYVREQSFQQTVANSLKQFILETEQQSQGVVPPKFIRQEFTDMPDEQSLTQ